MKNMLMVLALLVLLGGGLSDYQRTVSAQRSRFQELENENAELREKLDAIENLATEAKSDLDDVETAVQTDEPCEDTSAYSNATDVEDKLNEIETEASH